MKERPYFLPERQPTIISDYFEIERLKRDDLPKEEWIPLALRQFEMLRVIMQNPILKPEFFKAVDRHLEEMRKRAR